MMLKSLLTLCAASAALAQTVETSSASSVAATTTVSQSMPATATQGFNIAGVTSTDLFNWCHSQLNTCPQICGGSAAVNYCDQTSLQYTCTCANGTSPDSTAFIGTVPYFVCQQTYIQCVANNPNDAQAQTKCAENEQCGSRNATAEAIAAQSASAASETTASSTEASETSSATDSASDSASATSDSAATSTSEAAAAANTQGLATGATAVLLMAAMKLLL
ncbi:hypothetical protein DV738_g4064, partial [Chaetothyriales sp. CBS 135597]